MNAPIDTPTQDIALAYQSLRQALLGFLRKQVASAVDAEDLLHEVFLKALGAMERGDRPQNLTGWLYTIARNTIIDYYRAKRPTEQLPENLVATPSHDNLAEQALATCLTPMAQQLPALYRDTLLATDFEGQTMQAVATREKVTLSAIKSRASRGRKLLRQSLLACCKVELTRSGQVLDYQPHQKNTQCKHLGSCCS